MKTTMRMSKIERAMLENIAKGWSRAKDDAQKNGLLFEIQFAFGCSYGRALCLANEVRVNYFKD